MNRSAVIKLKLNEVSTLQEKLQNSKSNKVLSTKSHKYLPLWRTINPVFFFIAEFCSFVLQRLVGEKFNFKWKNPCFVVPDRNQMISLQDFPVCTAGILAYSSPAFSFSFSLFIFFLCLLTYSTA